MKCGDRGTGREHKTGDTDPDTCLGDRGTRRQHKTRGMSTDTCLGDRGTGVPNGYLKKIKPIWVFLLST